MKNAGVIIIGAGAAGLMAAYELSKAGKQVMVLEARGRAGGRMYTLDDDLHTQLGAEFVHGDLPVTLQLLKEANIESIPASGEMWHSCDGKFSKNADQFEHWDLLMEKLNQLKNDISIGDFLQQEFGDEKYTTLREWVTRFVSGYDTADPFKASAFALRREWQSEDDEQHRVKGGYGRIISYLVNTSEQNGAQFYLNTVVKHIYWTHGQVEVVTSGNESFKAKQLIIALPLGVLKASPSEQASITISPSVGMCKEAIGQIGFGSVVKVLLQFKTAFWEDQSVTGVDLGDMGFILSDEAIPTWWTQRPLPSTLLTGWLGGPPVERKKHMSNDELLEEGLQSLSNIFNINPDKLKNDLVASHVVNWTTDPFTLGSYAYDTIESAEARKVLNTPINYTIYFAGEYLYDGPAMGTVEAALKSGLETAMKLID
ncbi:MAG: FAD-dependent oxidoreductase [Bacteroidetes bacterium]|jgi:monoamine oxidase|nr:FAD-dependent oxidoreductase [Bacteroidota bacterium]